MRISARIEYALLALVELADSSSNSPLQSKEISARAGVPKPFLDQLLLDLRRSGLIRSVRGPGGGYILARNAKDISMRDAISAVEGGSLITQCAVKTGKSTPCRETAVFALLEVWREIDAAREKILNNITIADLNERQRTIDGQEMYYI